MYIHPRALRQQGVLLVWLGSLNGLWQIANINSKQIIEERGSLKHVKDVARIYFPVIKQIAICHHYKQFVSNQRPRTKTGKRIQLMETDEKGTIRS